MKTIKSLSLLVALSMGTHAHAVLFHTDDIRHICEDSQKFQVPALLQGRFMETTSNGWIEVDANGISKLDWKKFNFYSEGFSGKGFCLRHELIEESDGTVILRLTMERKQNALAASDKESYTVEIGVRSTKEYFASASSSGSLNIIGIPLLGGSTLIKNESIFSRVEQPETPQRKVSSN